MKTIFCLFSLMLLLNYSIAQKASFGITAGATFASYKATVDIASITSETKTGFNVGLVMSSPISKNISFRPELKYVQKGGSYTEEGYSDKITVSYIELPMDFVFNTGTSKGMFFGGLGPSFNIGLSGKDKWDYGDGDAGEDDVKFGNGADDSFKPFEFGVNVLAGYQFAGGFFISANYNAGLNNISNDDDPEFDTKYHNRYFGLNIGIMFKRKTKAAAAVN
jgi:hypothetical protein